MPISICILIASRYRLESLGRLLETISSMKTPKAVMLRVIIVDNSDEPIIEETLSMKHNSFPIKIFHEPRPGVSRARNLGLKNCMPWEYICIVDDDCLLPIDFLYNVRSAILNNGQDAIIGGAVLKVSDEDFDISIKSQKNRQKYKGGPDIFGKIHGCCMIIPASIIARVGFFDERFGPGTKCCSAEDSEYSFRAWYKGVSVTYDPAVFLWHDHRVRDKETYDKIRHAYNVGKGAFYAKYFLKFNRHIIRMAYWGISRKAYVPTSKMSKFWPICLGVLYYTQYLARALYSDNVVPYTKRSILRSTDTHR